MCCDRMIKIIKKKNMFTFPSDNSAPKILSQVCVTKIAT